MLVVLLKKTDYNTKVVEIDGKISSLDDKVAKNKNYLVKNLMESAKELIPYMSKGIFDAEDGTQVYLIFQPVHKYIKITANTKFISSWKSKGLSDESIKPFPTSNTSLTPLIDYYDGYYRRVKLQWKYFKTT